MLYFSQKKKGLRYYSNILGCKLNAQFFIFLYIYCDDALVTTLSNMISMLRRLYDVTQTIVSAIVSLKFLQFVKTFSYWEFL